MSFKIYGPPRYLDVRRLRPRPTALVVYDEGLPRDLLEPATEPTYPAGAPAFVGNGPHAHQLCVQADDKAVAIGTANRYGVYGGSFSVVVCLRPAAPASGGLTNETTYVGIDDPDAAAARGWYFGFTSMIVPSGVTLFVPKDSGGITFQSVSSGGAMPGGDYLNDLVVGANYCADDGRAAVYKDGRMLANATLFTGANQAGAGANPLLLGGRLYSVSLTGGEGRIYWVALFDECLTDEEMMAFMTNPWGRDPEDMVLGGTVGQFTTRVDVAKYLTVSSDQPDFETAVEGFAVQGGVGGTPVDDTPEFETLVNCSDLFGSGVPTLTNFITNVAVGAGATSLDAGSPVSFSTEVGVRSKVVGKIAGQGYILGNSRRYRR